MRLESLIAVCLRSSSVDHRKRYFKNIFFLLEYHYWTSIIVLHDVIVLVDVFHDADFVFIFFACESSLERGFDTTVRSYNYVVYVINRLSQDILRDRMLAFDL